MRILRRLLCLAAWFSIGAALVASASAAEIALSCKYPSRDRHESLYEISDTQVVEDGKKINADDIAITDRFISWTIKYGYPLNSELRYKVDRSTGDLVTDVYMTMKMAVVQQERAKCEKTETTPRKF
jgi:hypothetical protein